MPHTRKEMIAWAKDVWAKITGNNQEEKESASTSLSGWVCRDAFGGLGFAKLKPRKNPHGYWSGIILILDYAALPQVKWEDDEPTPCEIIVKPK